MALGMQVPKGTGVHWRGRYVASSEFGDEEIVSEDSCGVPCSWDAIAYLGLIKPRFSSLVFVRQ